MLFRLSFKHDLILTFNTLIMSKTAPKFFVFILALCFSKNCFSQGGIVTLLIDPTMMMIGPYDTSTSGELDFILKVADKTNNHETGLSLEVFDAIDYYSAGVFSNYNISSLNIKNIEYTVGGEVGLIERNIDEEMSIHPSFAFNTSIRLSLNEDIGVELASSIRYRNDLVHIYDESQPMKFNGYVGMIYKW